MTPPDTSRPSLDARDHNFRIPFIVGVTGHRDLRSTDLPKLREVLANELGALQKKLPSTPMIMLSPLAEGADRLAAETALKLGWEVIAALPLPIAEYERDFETADSRAEFNHLLKQCLGYFAVPLPQPLSSDDRTKAYQAVGRYIASHAQIMIALWDGSTSTKPAGTSVIVDWRLTHTHHFGQPPLTPDPVASGPILHIRTPRLSGAKIERPLEVDWLYPSCTASAVDLGEPERDCDKRSMKLYDGLAGRQDAYNSYVGSALSSFDGAFQQSIDSMVPPAKIGQISRSGRRLLRAFAAADTLAIANQKHTRRTLNILCALVLGAVILYELVSHILHPHASSYSGVLVGFSLLLIAAVWQLNRARKKNFQAHYQDRRALAEGLRVQFFWHTAGITDSVAAHYLNHARELGWIRSALHGFACLAQVTMIPTPNLSLARDHWVEHQRTFFAKRTPGEKKQLHFWENCKGFFLWLSVALAFLGAVVISGGLKDWFWPRAVGAVDGQPSAQASLILHHTPAWESWLLAGVGLTLVLSAMAHFYSEKRAFAAHARQYAPIRDLYDEALRRFDIIDSDKSISGVEKERRLQDLLRELGCDALAENAEWLSAHRERPLEVPVP